MRIIADVEEDNISAATRRDVDDSTVTLLLLLLLLLMMTAHTSVCVCVCSHNDDCVIVARRFINPPASPATYISTPNAGRHQSSPRRRLPPASVECVRRRC